MKIMRLIRPRSKTRFSIPSMLKDFSFEPNPSLLQDLEFRRGMEDRYRMIGSCQYANFNSKYVISKTSNDCELFSPVPTSLGICHAFNAPPIGQDVMQESKFLSAFVTAYGQDFLVSNSSQLLPIFGNGMQLGLEMFLNKNSFLEMTNSTPDYLTEKSFLIGINQNFNFFDMRTNNIRATLGQRTIIMLEPMELRY